MRRFPVTRRSVRDRCEAVLEAVGAPEPFTVDGFVAHVAEQRARPIHLLEMDSKPGAPCGLWVGLDQADYVFHERSTTPLHRDHIVLHEMGHLLCDHETAQEGADSALAQLLPDLNPETIRQVLGRTAYDSRQEQEAEVFASMLLQRRAAASQVAASAATPEDVRLRRRLAAALVEPEEGWSG